MQTGGYSDDQSVGIAGQVADASDFDAVSLQNSESGGVGFGLAVVDKFDGTFEDPDSAVKKIRGVLMHSHAYDNTDLDPAGVPTKQMGDVMKRGKVVVVPETAVSINDEVYYRFAGSGTKGTFGHTYTAGETLHLNRARFRSAADASEPAILELLDGVGEPDLVQITGLIAGISADATVELGAVPTGRHVKVKSAYLSCGVVAGDGTDHWIIQLRAGTGPTVLASYDTDTAAQGAITQNTPKAMSVASTAGLSGERLYLNLDKQASGANITAGAISVTLEVY